jgi:hypothetical protein
MLNQLKYLIIGAGPSGLAGARNFQKYEIPFEVVESYSDVGGLWNIENPQSTVYKSAHLISSKTMTEFTEFPMDEQIAPYPSHADLLEYFKKFAKHFNLYAHIKFKTKVNKIKREGENWKVTFSDGHEQLYRGIVLASGTLHEPTIPQFKGEFTGEMIHSSKYKNADVFKDKRVLIIGAGNSGCDIAVDAIHYAKKVDISLRRGYHFVPKFIMGRPADAMGKIKLPAWLKQKIDSVILKLFTGDPEKFGFPKPDHKLYESHPIVNSLILHHLGHGDIKVQKDIDHFEGKKVYFKDNTSQEYDLILLATGYKLHYPYIEKSELNWTQGAAPQLFLNIFHPTYQNVFVLGMVEAAGIGWQGRYEQAELIALFIKSQMNNRPIPKFMDDKKELRQNLSGGLNYVKLDRMAYYVHKDTYRSLLNLWISKFKEAL